MLNYFGQQRPRILLATPLILLCLLLISGVGQSGALLASNAGGSADTLFYTLHDLNGTVSLMMYDAQQDVSTLLLTEPEFKGGILNVNGWLAFSAMNQGDAEIYVLDVLSENASPINISHNPTVNDYPLAWSPDGRYLAFGTYQDDESHLIYVWNGETVINITPANMDAAAERYDASWSFDGRLAFTATYSFSSLDEDGPSEIYLWDGSITTSLSQNPTGEDREPVWNTDGSVAFLSARDSYDILVWDGVSLRNGAPDVDTYTNISPELTDYMSFPTWTNNGLLAFIASGTQDDGRYQIYLWDGQTATNISQNPTLHNGNPTWSADGRWAFATFFSSQQLLYVRDADNRPLLTVEGQYPPAWSSSGYLAFCQPHWVLSMWGGQQVVEVARGQEIWAQWQSGASVVCSSG